MQVKGHKVKLQKLKKRFHVMPRGKKKRNKKSRVHRSNAPSTNQQTQSVSFMDDGSFRFIEDYKWSESVPSEALKKYNASRSRAAAPTKYREFKGKNKMVSIRKIIDSSHPACGQHGLFANRKIAANTHIIDYVGFVEIEANESKTSDYIIHFVDALSCDAEHIGNEARFINDYRNINDQGPNVKFLNYKSDKGRHATLRLGVFSCSKPIKKGQELLVSYGKGFWKARSPTK